MSQPLRWREVADVIRRRVVVSGRVQGVFFRDSCRYHAQAQQVTGWVANRSDGRVEAVFEGTSAAVARMVAWCRIGPARAHVTGVHVTEEQVEGLTSFLVR